VTIQTSERFLAAVTALAEQSATSLVDIRFLEPGLIRAWERDDCGGPMGPCIFFDQSLWRVKQSIRDGDADIDFSLRRRDNQPIGSLFADEIEVETLVEAEKFVHECMEPCDELIHALSV